MKKTVLLILLLTSTLVISQEKSKEEIRQLKTALKQLKKENRKTPKNKPFKFVELKDNNVSNKRKGISQPIMIGCDPAFDNTKMSNCLRLKISSFINRNFDIYVVKKQKLKVNSLKLNGSFIIDVEGEIANIEVSYPNKAINEEFKRVLNKIPKMIPAKKHGKPTHLKYDVFIIIPIINSP